MRFIGRSFAVYHYPLNNAVRLHFVYYIIVVAVRSLWACRLFLYCIMSVVPAPASGALASAAVILARATAHVPRKGWRCLVLVVARLFRCRARRAGGVSPANLRPALSLHKLRIKIKCVVKSVVKIHLLIRTCAVIAHLNMHVFVD